MAIETKRVFCKKCKKFTEHTMLERLTGTPGYYRSTVGRGVDDWWRFQCDGCQKVSVGNFGSD